MKKLNALVNEKTFGTLVLTFLIAIILGLGIGIIKFDKNQYDSSLLKNFLFYYILENSFIYIPAIFAVTLFYTINALFPEVIRNQFKISNQILLLHFLKVVVLFIIFCIFLLEIIPPLYWNIKNRLELKQKLLNIEKLNKEKVSMMLKEADNLLKEKEYYKSLEIYYEILLIMPDNRPAQDKINFIQEKLIEKNENEFKNLLKEGIEYYKRKEYDKAITSFKKALQIKSDSKEALKYYNISLQQLNISQQKILKDKYDYLISLYQPDNPKVLKERKIASLMQKGIIEFKNKNYAESKKYFKEVIIEQPYHYGANHYLSLINQRISQITYYTSSFNKLLKYSKFFLSDNTILFTKSLGKTKENQYVFFDATLYKIENNKLKTIFKKKYGYYDTKLKKWIFIDSFITDSKPEFLDNINPEIMWYFNELLDKPEKFSLSKILILKNYPPKINIEKNLKFNYSHKCIKLILIKILFYFFIILIFDITLYLGLKIRRKTGKSKAGYVSFIFIPILLYIFAQIINQSLFASKYIIPVLFRI